MNHDTAVMLNSVNHYTALDHDTAMNIMHVDHGTVLDYNIAVNHHTALDHDAAVILNWALPLKWTMIMDHNGALPTILLLVMIL